MKVADFTDDQIVAAVRVANAHHSGRAYHVCYRLDLRGTARFRAMHRRLCKLEAAGKVRRDPCYSAVNSIYWVVA